MFIKTIKDSEPRPTLYGFVKHSSVKHTRTYCPIPFSVIFRLIWIIWCFVCEPFPRFKRKLNIAVEATYERDELLAKREETLRVLTHYIKTQSERLESRKIGKTRFVNSVIAFLAKIIKEEEPELYDELYPSKIPDESTDK